MGHVCSRFFTHLPANPALHLQKIPPKSFVQRILPVTPTRSTVCAQNPANSMKTRNFVGGGGGGVPKPRYFPFRKSKFSHPGPGRRCRAFARKDSTAPQFRATARPWRSEQG